MDFGDAIRALKDGQRVRRTGWNGKGMWLGLTWGTTIPIGLARAGAAEWLRKELEAEGFTGSNRTGPIAETMVIGSHIDMRAADGSLVIGWLASQTDMLTDDWEVVP